MKTFKTRTRRVLPWLPALLVLGAGFTTAIGLSPAGSAVGATSTQTITATAGAQLTFTPCADPAVATLTATAANNVDDNIGACTVAFSTNNGTQATLQLDNNHDGNAFFCERATAATAACTVGQGTFAAAVAATDLADGQVGIMPSTPTNCALANYTLTTTKYPVNDAATTVCQTTGTAAGSWTGTFYADATGTQSSGTYYGQFILTATSS